MSHVAVARLLKWFLWAGGVPLRRKRVLGRKATQERAAIIVAAPHASIWDAGTVSLACGMPSFVSRVENRSIPILGSKPVLFGHFLGPGAEIPVEKGDNCKAISAKCDQYDLADAMPTSRTMKLFAFSGLIVSNCSATSLTALLPQILSRTYLCSMTPIYNIYSNNHGGIALITWM